MSQVVTNIFFLALLLLPTGCGFIGQAQIGLNSAPILVGNCGPTQYPNEPCVTVTVCSPGSNACATIPNVVLDTGSYGLRVFAPLVPVPLQPLLSSSGQRIAECSPFAQGTSDWGPVVAADVIIAGEKAPAVPIQLIDSTFGQVPQDCQSPDTDPQSAGYNGILGVGVDITDCGSACAAYQNNRIYFGCGGPNCASVSVPIGQQVSNPVALMPFDNNGITIQFPLVPPSGAPAVTGTLLLGVGTQPDNTPVGATVFPTDSTGLFITTFNGTPFKTSFIDSGSNGIFFPSSLPQCSSSGVASGFFCPPGFANLTATQIGLNGQPARTISFQVANAEAEINSNLMAFANLAGSSSDPSFDWGLPFFMGRTIYFQITGRSSSLGVGPFYAY